MFFIKIFIYKRNVWKNKEQRNSNILAETKILPIAHLEPVHNNDNGLFLFAKYNFTLRF